MTERLEDSREAQAVFDRTRLDGESIDHLMWRRVQMTSGPEWATWYGHERQCSFCGQDIRAGLEFRPGLTNSGRYACWLCSGRENRP